MTFENFDFASLMFYAFAAGTVGSALAVISSRNSVYSVFFLILAFFNAAGLFVLIGAEYLAMTLVIVYVGAVAVLFLFVVMMLNINFERLREGFMRYLPFGLLIAFILFGEIGALLYHALNAAPVLADAASILPDAAHINNTKAIGHVLYTHYFFLFQMAGLILLLSMIGAIVLTLRHRTGVKRQRIGKQVARTRAESVVLVDVKPGQGA